MYTRTRREIAGEQRPEFKATFQDEPFRTSCVLLLQLACIQRVISKKTPETKSWQRARCPTLRSRSTQRRGGRSRGSSDQSSKPRFRMGLFGQAASCCSSLRALRSSFRKRPLKQNRGRGRVAPRSGHDQRNDAEGDRGGAATRVQSHVSRWAFSDKLCLAAPACVHSDRHFEKDP